ncbi:hypothetical protein ACQWHL_25440, partial [Salmonella enterica subsp. enterica serovar Infantis]
FYTFRIILVFFLMYDSFVSGFFNCSRFNLILLVIVLFIFLLGRWAGVGGGFFFLGGGVLFIHGSTGRSFFFFYALFM